MGYEVSRREVRSPRRMVYWFCQYSRSDGYSGSLLWKPDWASVVDFEVHCTCSSGTLAFFFSCSGTVSKCIAGASTHQQTLPAQEKQLWTPRIPTRGPHKMMSLPPARSGPIIAGWPSHHSDKIYSAMSHSTVYRYAAHMQDMFQLIRAIDALSVAVGCCGSSQEPCCRAQRLSGYSKAQTW